MALQMKRACEQCACELAMDGEAWMCSYECTFCPSCSREMALTCPNCGGELVRRPRRVERGTAIWRPTIQGRS